MANKIKVDAKAFEKLKEMFKKSTELVLKLQKENETLKTNKKDEDNGIDADTIKIMEDFEKLQKEHKKLQKTQEQLKKDNDALLEGESDELTPEEKEALEKLGLSDEPNGKE